MKQKQGVARTVWELAEPLCEEFGYILWDVEYVREAGDLFLRCFIKKEGGVTIDHCVSVNHAMSKALDEADFIEDPYTLEVSSPGLGRRLTKDRHLEQEIGSDVDLKLYQAIDGVKVFTGVLKAFDKDAVTIETDGNDAVFSRKDIASLKLTLDL